MIIICIKLKQQQIIGISMQLILINNNNLTIAQNDIIYEMLKM
ncbi:unnamed protein product [Paramecium sonneborni]|uniref:Uncharacterized protein n=1 Tax=Paramecium sonneborni TaxID=65129 RepID=A0A8S1QUH1_9CILI|nr:unnamed protein product [Paramecium sonneborni]